MLSGVNLIGSLRGDGEGERTGKVSAPPTTPSSMEAENEEREGEKGTEMAMYRGMSAESRAFAMRTGGERRERRDWRRDALTETRQMEKSRARPSLSFSCSSLQVQADACTGRPGKSESVQSESVHVSVKEKCLLKVVYFTSSSPPIHHRQQQPHQHLEEREEDGCCRRTLVRSCNSLSLFPFPCCLLPASTEFTCVSEC